MSSGGGGASSASKTINGISTGAAQTGQNLVQGMPGQTLGAQYLPQLQGVSASQYNLGDPNWGYGNQAMVGSGQAANYGAQTAAQTAGYAQGLIPYAQQLQGYGTQAAKPMSQLQSYGNQVAQMGMDPQSALYNRTLQQVQDQARVANAASGVAMSPYGAGVENQALNNFNIDWQNQLLNRATQGIQAQQGADTAAAGLGTSAAGIGTQAAGLGSTAFNLGSGATDLAASAAKVPYTTQQGLLQDQYNALTGVGSGTSTLNQPLQQTISNYSALAGLGPAYSNAASQAQQAGTNQITGLSSIPLSLLGKH